MIVLVRISEDGKTVVLLRNRQEESIEFDKFSESDRKLLTPRIAHFAPASKSNPISVPGDIATIEEALKRAQDGDVILIKKGVYRIAKPLHISRSITIRGEGTSPEDTVLESDQESLLIIDSEYKYMSIENLAFRVKDTKKIEEREDATDKEKEKNRQLRRKYSSVAIHNGNPIFTNCHFESNSGGFGFYATGEKVCPLFRKCSFINSECGVVFEELAQGIFEQCTFFENSVHGIQLASSECRFTECDLSKNKNIGIQLFGKSKCILHKCNINNSSIGIRVEDSRLDARECTLQSNGKCSILFHKAGGWIMRCDIAEHEFAGIVVSDESDPSFWSCKIHDGERGIFITKESKPKFENCEIFDHSVAGVMVDEEANPTVDSCKIFKNNAGIVVGLHGKGSFSKCKISGGEYGLVVDIDRSRAYPVFQNCTVKNNKYGIAYKNQKAGKYIKNTFFGNKHDRLFTGDEDDADANAERNAHQGQREVQSRPIRPTQPIEREENVPEKRKTRCTSCSGTGRKQCTHCKGTGTERGACSVCKGKGMYFSQVRSKEIICPECNGARKSKCHMCGGGNKRDYPCPSCYGTGYR